MSVVLIPVALSAFDPIPVGDLVSRKPEAS
jgi:hypothetical protein